MSLTGRLPHLVLLFLILAGLGYGYYRATLTVCDRTLHYRIGSFDDRFGISQTAFEDAISQAEAVWEAPFERNLFARSETADFTINLIFDERQQELLDQQALEEALATDEKTLGELRDQYARDLTLYNQAVAAYTADIAYWNEQGGAPPEEYQVMEAEKRRLNRRANELRTVYDHLSGEIDQFNQEIDLYNAEAGRIFDQGEYVGTAINVYQFEDLPNLWILLAHELGHALSLEHVEDPQAIMYYLLQEQDLATLHLTEADTRALTQTCRLDLTPRERLLVPVKSLWQELL